MSESSAISGQDTIQESFAKRITALESENRSLQKSLRPPKWRERR